VGFGENRIAEFPGDLGRVEYSAGDASAWNCIRELRGHGIPVVAVVFVRAPLVGQTRKSIAADAFIAAWLPGTRGVALADVLFKARDGSAPKDFRGKTVIFVAPPRHKQPAVNRGDGVKPCSVWLRLRYADNGNLPMHAGQPRPHHSAATDRGSFLRPANQEAGWRWVASRHATD